MPTSPLPVLAGLDDSHDSALAVEAAAAEANCHRLPLWLVIPGCAPSADSMSSWRPVADPLELLDRTATRLSARYPDLDVIVEVSRGDPAALLVEESGGASLVVVGPDHADTRVRCPVVVAAGGPIRP